MFLSRKSSILFICCAASLVVTGSARRREYEKFRFETAVSKALKSVQQILDTTREPRLLEYEDHQYDDKYALAEFITNMAIASNLQVLEQLGLKDDLMQNTLLPLVHKEKRSVWMRFQAEESCSFIKEQEVEIPSTHSVEYEVTTTMEEGEDEDGGYFSRGSSSSSNKWKETTTKTKSRVISTIKEYHWKVSTLYNLTIFVLNNNSTGTSSSSSYELSSHRSSTIVKTSGGGGGSPMVEKHIRNPIDINLTWLFQMISSASSPSDEKQDKDSTTNKLTTTETTTFSIHRFETNKEEEENNGNNATVKTTPISGCNTPRRNKDVEKALQFNQELFQWCGLVKWHFEGHVEQNIMSSHRPVLQERDAEDIDLDDTNGNNNNIIPKLSWVQKVAGSDIFVPIVPFMEQNRLLSGHDMELFLNHQKTTMQESIEKVSNIYPQDDAKVLLTNQEAIIVLLCEHLAKLTQQYQDSMNYIEYLLEQQLIQAIGKELGPKDLEEYMRFHTPKLFDNAYKPTPFSYSIRRPNHFPDGTVSILQTGGGGGGGNQPIETFVRYFPGSTNTGEKKNRGIEDHDEDDDSPTTASSSSSIFIPMNAATSVEITGDRYLHGWIQYRWEQQQQHHPHYQQQVYQLIARANQFSSFLLVIGTMAGPDIFQAKHAILLQNKDEVIIKLITDVLPSAKEFKDAISSLSPEQQQFARAFREMQLESSVFGICIIQLKPQLEKLLGLPQGALTKEIQLTQDLMSLFIDYQIPSDLLSFDGADTDDVSTKVDAVKNYTKAVMDVIDNAKKKQLEEEERRADMKEMKGGTRSREFKPLQDEFHGASAGRRVARSASAERSVSYMAATTMMAAADSLGQQPPSATPSSSSAPSSAPSVAPAASMDQASSSESSSTASKPVEEQRQPQEQHGREQQQQQQQVEGQDFTLLPKLLDQKLERYDSEGSLRSTILKTCDNDIAHNCWSRIRQENLLLPPKRTNGLSTATIESEKNNAFDLLVAISRSGSLPIDHSELHVIVAVSHCFEKDIMSTVIQDNINPIEKVEKSMLLVASTIFNDYGGEEENAVALRKLIRDDQAVERLTQSFPVLFNITNSTKSDAPVPVNDAEEVA